MNEPDLYKFFSGGFSEKEKLYLKLYLDKHPDYFEHFQKERKIYNLSLFSHLLELPKSEETVKKPLIKKLHWTISKVAVIFLFAFIGFYFFNEKNSDTPSEIAYQTIKVPFGQRVNIDLPDGSKVWLNAGTSIKYPVSFNQNIREVILEGEAYFEIYKNENLPFCVSAGNHKIEVLGTKFNVNVDVLNNKFETALFEGSVKIVDPTSPDKSVKLEPNTLFRFADGDLKISPITHLEKFDWKDGVLCFHKDRFEDVMAVFEKSYGCNIKILNRNVDQYLYTGKFLQTDGIDYALGLLQESIRFSYSRDKKMNTIIIE